MGGSELSSDKLSENEEQSSQGSFKQIKKGITMRSASLPSNYLDPKELLRLTSTKPKGFDAI